jgi:hypothetical protein
MKKKPKRYRVLCANGDLWWNERVYGFLPGIAHGSRMTKSYAEKIKRTINYSKMELVEVGIKPNRRELFRSSFLRELDKLCKRYGTTSIETTYDTFYIGGWD